MSELVGKKEGLATKQEISFFVKLAVDKLDINAIYKTGIKLILPAVVNSLDNKVGDKLPEPWQTYVEDLITMVYEFLQDEKLSDEELDRLLEKIALVLSTEINVPLLGDEDQLVAFEFLLKFLVAQIKIAVKNRKK